MSVIMQPTALKSVFETIRPIQKTAAVHWDSNSIVMDFLVMVGSLILLLMIIFLMNDDN